MEDGSCLFGVEEKGLVRSKFFCVTNVTTCLFFLGCGVWNHVECGIMDIKSLSP